MGTGRHRGLLSQRRPLDGGALDLTSGVRTVSHRLVIEPFLPPLYDDYDIHPDGRTLVMVRPSGVVQAREVTVVVNWFSELRSIVRASRDRR